MITIRQATDADVPTLANLNDEVQKLHALLRPGLFKGADECNPQPTLHTFVTYEQFRTLVACDGDTPVGYLAMVLKDSAGNDFYHPMRTAFIHHIAVSNANQRRDSSPRKDSKHSTKRCNRVYRNTQQGRRSLPRSPRRPSRKFTTNVGGRECGRKTM